MPPRTNASKKRVINGVVSILVLGIAYFSIRPFLEPDVGTIAGTLIEKPTTLPPRGARKQGLDNSIIPSPPSKEDEQDEIYIVFSTSCTPQQHWESYVLFYHAYRIQQPGTITRIASGCNENQAQSLQEFHDAYISTLSPHFYLHLTPDFSRVHLEQNKHPYKYNNKPFGVLHWMENGPLRNNLTNSKALFMLIDPDMIFLRPITSASSLATDASLLWVDPKSNFQQRLATNGPVSQQDGYLNNAWMNLMPLVLPSNHTAPEKRDGPVRWNSGPPYLGPISDWYNLTRRWTTLAGPVLENHPHLFAEMFSLILSAVDLEKPFTMAAGFVVSTTESSNREGWKYIDALEDPCATAQQAMQHQSTTNSLPTLPYILHYCKRYGIGRHFFSKYRIKKTILSCTTPLMTVPDSQVFLGSATSNTRHHMIYPPRADGKDKATYVEDKHNISPRQAKRETFMVCGLTTALNEALRHFKQQACKDVAGTNFNTTYMIIDDPGNT